MLDFLIEIGGKLTQMMGRVDSTTWSVIAIGTILTGFLCLRGFGSRKYY